MQFTLDPSQGLVHRIPLSKQVLLQTLLKEVLSEVRPASSYEANLWRRALEKGTVAENDFLWHSLSALHLIHMGRANGNHHMQYKSMEIASQHHIRASKLFRTTSLVINESNWPVVLGFAISVIVCQLAMQASCPAPFFDHIEMFQVLRASRDIDKALGGWLVTSEMWPLIQKRTSVTTCDASDYGLQGALLLLDGAVEQTRPHAKHSECNFLALQRLKEWTKRCENRPRRWSHYVHWPAVVPAEFTDALREGDELAQILVLHWVAIIKLAPPRWFMQRWLVRTYSSTCQS